MCASYVLLRINCYFHLLLNLSVTAYRILYSCLLVNCLHISFFLPTSCLVKTIQKSFLCLQFIILCDITFSHPAGDRRLKVLVDGSGINKWITLWFPGVYAIFRFAQYLDSPLDMLSEQQSAWARLGRKGPLSTCPRVAASELLLRTGHASFQFPLPIIRKREVACQFWDRINFREQKKACLINTMSAGRLRL
jgi:hypothetical protein